MSESSFENGQIPPQLTALTEDHPDLSDVLTALSPRLAARDVELTRCGFQDAAHQLDGRALAGAIGTDQAHSFTLADLQIEVLEGDTLLSTQTEQVPECSRDPRASVEGMKDPAERAGFDQVSVHVLRARLSFPHAHPGGSAAPWRTHMRCGQQGSVDAPL